MIANLEQHSINRGYGPVGRRAADDSEASGRRHVVLDTGARAIEPALRHGILSVGSDDGSLQSAGVEHTGALLALGDSDAQNPSSTLSARSLSADLNVIGSGPELKALEEMFAPGTVGA